MKLSRSIRVSYDLLAAHRLRTLLSMLGIVVGVAAVVLMVALGRGAEERLVERIRIMGTNLVVVNAGQTANVGGRQRQVSRVTTLVPEDAAAIREDCPAVVHIAPALNRQAVVRYEGTVANTSLVGMPAQGFGIRNYSLESGRFYDETEERGRRRVAVLGPTAATNLFGPGNPVGLEFRVGRVLFEVIGVTRSKGVDANGADQDDVVFVPLGTAMRRLFNVEYLDLLYVQARSSDALGRAEEEIRSVLRERHRLRAKPDDFTVQNQATLLAAERETSRSLTLLVGSVAAISLLVGGVGILAVMLITVRERTREIGLRRALGARRRDVRNQFLMESSLLSGAGALAGVLIGLVGAVLSDWLGGLPAAVSWPMTLGAYVFSAGLGTLFGLYPALRASRMPPTEALRAD